MSMVSLVATHWIFAKWGRRIGFWFGCGLGIVGSLVGCWGLIESSAAIVLFAQFLMGGGLGIGVFALLGGGNCPSRLFFQSRGVGFGRRLLGGIHWRPEMSQVTKGMFGDGNLTFAGTFVAGGGFFFLHLVCWTRRVS